VRIVVIRTGFVHVSRSSFLNLPSKLFSTRPSSIRPLLNINIVDAFPALLVAAKLNTLMDGLTKGNVR
jgi:hypothetical protein